MRKRVIAILVALMLVVTTIPAFATEITQDSEASNAGGTEVVTEDTGADNGDQDADADADAGEDIDIQEDEPEPEPEPEDEISKYQKGLAAYIRRCNSNIGKKWSITLAGYFIKYGDRYDIDEKVVMALAQRESNFRAKAKSRYGYKGMMQMNDSFATSNGYKPSDLYNAEVSIKLASRYISKMKKKYGTYTKAICCYVCGSGAVATGRYSKEPGWSVMKMRTKIKTYLKDRDYI
jgi:hypothetical protein